MKSAVVAVIMVLFAVPAVAVTYQWEDNQGTMNFTEDPGSIPKQYRKKAKVLGGEEEVAPAENSDESAETPAAAEAGEKGKVAEKPSGEKDDDKKAYGGKSSDSWRKDFAEIGWKIKSEEEQLSQLQERMKDTSKMSRSEYLSIQFSIKNTENRLQGLREKRESLASEADRAGVPDELRGAP